VSFVDLLCRVRGKEYQGSWVVLGLVRFSYIMKLSLWGDWGRVDYGWEVKGGSGENYSRSLIKNSPTQHLQRPTASPHPNFKCQPCLIPLETSIIGSAKLIPYSILLLQQILRLPYLKHVPNICFYIESRRFLRRLRWAGTSICRMTVNMSFMWVLEVNLTI